MYSNTSCWWTYVVAIVTGHLTCQVDSPKVIPPVHGPDWILDGLTLDLSSTLVYLTRSVKINFGNFSYYLDYNIFFHNRFISRVQVCILKFVTSDFQLQSLNLVQGWSVSLESRLLTQWSFSLQSTMLSVPTISFIILPQLILL